MLSPPIVVVLAISCALPAGEQVRALAQAPRSQPTAPASRPAGGVHLNPVPEVVAVVNGTSLSREAFLRELKRLIPQTYFHARVPADKEGAMREQALASLIDSELTVQDARRRGLSISEPEMLEEVRQGLQKVSEAERNRYAGKEMELLERFRDAIERRLLIAKVEAQVVPKQVVLTEADLLQEYSEHPDRYQRPGSVYLHHILIKVDPAASGEEMRERFEFTTALREQILAGEASFAQIAKQHSQDIFAPRGGELGWVEATEVSQPKVAEAAFALDVGGISEVITTMYGFHIVQVTDRKEATPLRFDEAVTQIRENLQRERIARIRREWMRELRSAARIEIEYVPVTGEAERPAPTGVESGPSGSNSA